MASTRFVFPCPLRPRNAVAPGSSGTSAVAYERKSCRKRCETYKRRLALRGAGGSAGRRAGARTLVRVHVATGRGTGTRGVAAELVAHGGDRLHRGALVLAGEEAREERGGDRGERHRVVDRGLDGPAPPAGVLRVAGDLVEVAVVLERLDEQVEQPGADDGALAPGVEDLGDVLDQVDLLEQLEALGVGLHDRVLDAVVDHLGEVTGARRPPRVHE